MAAPFRGWLLCFLWVACAIARASCKSYFVVLEDGSLLSESEKNPALKNAAAAKAYKEHLVKEHNEILSAHSTEGEKTNKIHDYFHVINGFSASLSDDQVKKLKAHKRVKYVVENKLRRLSSVVSAPFKFMGLQGVPNAVWSKTTGKDIVIGIIDTGIFPESPSFNDSGLKPFPTKAICQKPISGPPFSCNNKIIGARYFYQGYVAENGGLPQGDYLSARDIDGHGTHVASIAAGSPVYNIMNISAFSGVSFNSRIMVYKVLWGLGENATGSDADVIAALDAGVEDGVDVFSLSLESPGAPKPYYLDSVIMAILEVSARGIPSVLSAGNLGAGTVGNAAPWCLTVAASSFPFYEGPRSGSINLRNGEKFKGSPSPDWGSLSSAYYPLVNSITVSNSLDITLSELCYPGSLDPVKTRGKIVVCLGGEIFRTYKSLAVFEAGGKGMILYNQEGVSSLFSDSHSVPTLHVYRESGLSIIRFINSTRNPTGISNYQPVSTPYITDFSSTGPNTASLYILKPDIAAPGDNVIGAYTNFSSTTFEPMGTYELFSGTSMATPHVSAAVGLLKSLKKSWKPSWLYSAIITSGTSKTSGTCIQDKLGNCATPLQMGGGHLDIRRAMDPGLVYNVSTDDYKNFLCTDTGGYYANVRDCPFLLREIDFNFPSLSIPNLSGRVVTRRRLTLVGPPAVYRAQVRQPLGATLKVSPSTLTFKTKHQTLAWNITVVAAPLNGSLKMDDTYFGYSFGTITWSDGVRSVKFNVALGIA